MEDAVGWLDPEKREAFRAEVTAKIPAGYNPWAHLAAPSIVGLGLTVAAFASVRGLTSAQALSFPAMLLIANASEWRIHRDLLHRRTRFCEILYDRHTPVHHRIYVRGDLSVRSTREWRLVLLPSFAIALLAVGIAPLVAGLAWAVHRNVGALVLAASMLYVVSYEWLHLAYHQPVDSFVGRRKVVRFLRQHHETHHDPRLMRRWNFNVTVGLWDLVRGTWHRGPLP